MRILIKFGRLGVGKRFWFNGVEFIKVDESIGRVIGSGKRVEFGWNTTIEIEV
jgi:hypothetical protein